jgi:glycosyltransferase involved in cell wall biosynthesis
MLLPELSPPDEASGAQWVRAIQDVISGRIKFDPAACRRRVMENFTHDKMAERYESVYRDLTL